MEKKKDGWKENSEKSAEFNVKVFRLCLFHYDVICVLQFCFFFLWENTHFSPKVFYCKSEDIFQWKTPFPKVSKQQRKDKTGKISEAFLSNSFHSGHRKWSEKSEIKKNPLPKKEEESFLTFFGGKKKQEKEKERNKVFGAAEIPITYKVKNKGEYYMWKIIKTHLDSHNPRTRKRT